MPRSGCEEYFDLDSVVGCSNYFDRGKVHFHILKQWYNPASHTYQVRISGNEPGIVFIKLLSKRNEDEISKHEILIENEYDLIKLMHEKCNSNEYAVVEPLECIKAKLALITKGVDGKRFDQALLNYQPFSSVNRSALLKGLTASGKWLRCLFESTKTSGKNYDIKHRIHAEIEMGLEVIQHYRKDKEWLSWRRTLVNQVGKLVKIINGSTLQQSLCHGDFIPGNMILSKTGKIVVLDLTDSSKGIIYDDLAKFWQWLDELGKRRPWYETNSIEKMKIHFLKGFFQGEIPWPLVNIFLIKKGIGRICNMVQTEPGGFLRDFIRERWVGDFMRERRVDYWKRKLLMIAEKN